MTEEKIGGIVYELRADISGLKKTLDDVRGMVGKRAKETENTFNKIRLDFDNRLAKMKISEIKAEHTKLTAEFKQKLAMDVDLSSLNETRQKLNSVKTALQDVEDKSRDAGKQIDLSFRGMATAVGIGFGFSQIAQFLNSLVRTAAEAEGVRQAFRRLGDPALLNNLREATRNTVSDLNLMKAAVRAENFQIPLTQLGTLLAFAHQRAKDTGEQVDYLVDSIVLGIGRKSPLILDNLGISAVRLREKFKGVSVEAGDVADVARAVGEIISEEMAKAGKQAAITSDKIGQVGAKLENLKEKAGSAIAPLVGFFASLIEKIDDFAIKADRWIAKTTGLKWWPTWDEGNNSGKSPKPGSNQNSGTGASIQAPFVTAGKTVGELLARIEQLKIAQESLIPGTKEYVKNVAEIAKIEKLLNTKPGNEQDSVKKMLEHEKELRTEYEKIQAALKDQNLTYFQRNELLKRAVELNKELHKYDLKPETKGIYTGKTNDEMARDINKEGMQPVKTGEKTQPVKESAGELEKMLELQELAKEGAASFTDTLSNGLADAIIKGRSLSDVFKNIGADLAAMLLKAGLFKGLTAIFPFLAPAGAMAHSGGTFEGVGGGNVMKLSRGGSFTVPPGFPNDSFGPLWVETGEKVHVTPANQASSSGSDGALSAKVDALGQMIIATNKNIMLARGGDTSLVGGVTLGFDELEVRLEKTKKIRSQLN